MFTVTLRKLYSTKILVKTAVVPRKCYNYIIYEKGITILNLRNRRRCQGNQNFTRFHMSMMLETAKMVLPEHQLP
jgi:hypothetical protein